MSKFSRLMIVSQSHASLQHKCEDASCDVINPAYHGEITITDWVGKRKHFLDKDLNWQITVIKNVSVTLKSNCCGTLNVQILDSHKICWRKRYEDKFLLTKKLFLDFLLKKLFL